MRNNKIFIILFAMIFTSCAKKEENPSTSLASSTFFAAECAQDHKGKSFKISDRYPESKRQFECLKDSDVATIKDAELKISLLASGSASIKLSCIEPNQHISFFERHRTSDIALVVDSVIVDSFSFSGPVGDKCGEFILSTYEDAIELCSNLAYAWKIDENKCATICKEEDSFCVNN
jgi:hypothetical protein